ncbi:MAG TPA: YbhB/YbcL family Raf kinase inhibitor-like protein [Pyrinomonadaceae bacterium]|nr:YbhB/YbcL family Raf kinase inhibitor-like protein [Pyrinomonadaceae bacterium]
MAITITSTAFGEGADIPIQYTCDGANISPPLSWTGVSPDAKSLILVVKDPDAPNGTFIHWVLYNLPPNIGGLPDDVPADENLDNGGQQCTNGFGDIGYGGPCPPPGDKAHRYFFDLYALDAEISLPSKVSESEINNTIRDSIVDEGHLMGKYQRQEQGKARKAG